MNFNTSSTGQQSRNMMTAELTYELSHLSVAQNVMAHRTDRNELTSMSEADFPPAICIEVRRDEPFDIHIRLNEPFDSSKLDDIRFTFTSGEESQPSDRAMIVLQPSPSLEPDIWRARIVHVNQEEYTILLRVSTPPDVTVGRWLFSCSQFNWFHGKWEYIPHQQIHLPFNPRRAGEYLPLVEKDLLKVIRVYLKPVGNPQANLMDRYEQAQMRDAGPSLDTCPPIRWGEPFDIIMQFHRPFDGSKDDILLNFSFGEDPPYVVLRLSDSKDEPEPGKWRSKIVNQDDYTITIRVFTPSNVTAGGWKFSFYIYCYVTGKWEYIRHQHIYNIYILSNPLCAGNFGQTFMGTPLDMAGVKQPVAIKSIHGECQSKFEEELPKVVGVDLRIAENAKAHHTDRYELTQMSDADVPLDPCLVVRRGEPFDIFIRFDRPFDSSKDVIQLIFDFGDKPRESRGTRVVLLLSDEDEPKKWGTKIMSHLGATFTIRIFTPPHVTVGKWKFSFNPVFRNDGKRENSYPVYILFNPWCADDQVFLGDESSRNEYVLNDNGRIFYGTNNYISSMPWNFGQFEDFVLDASLLLLDRSRLPISLRGNPIHVVRKISAIVNSNDDNGVLVGNWSGNYSGGTSPVAWNGSVAILEEYCKTRTPVKYGQCWVFSAIVTTICRAIGIPCRSVTNFKSAHDTDGNVTVDEYFDTNGEFPVKETNDSIWNFHVWNEVWMARPDLPSGYGGWQAIDATPQETSEGVSCTGPCSVEAIKQGFVLLPYDGSFIFAEVNADRIEWIRMEDGTWEHIVYENYIGKNISTKGPDGDQRLDVTNLYKFPEGSKEERAAVQRAVETRSTRRHLYRMEAREVDIDFCLVQMDSAAIGEPFDVVLKIRNKNTSQQRTVKATLTATVVKYTGVPVASIKSYSQAVIVMPNAEEEVKMTVTAKDYVDKVTDMCHVKIASMAQVEETKQLHHDSDHIRLSKSFNIRINVPAEIKLGEEFELEVYFTNPLPKMLTRSQFYLESPNLLRPMKVYGGDILPNLFATYSTKLTPRKEGETVVIVGFWSNELADIHGSAKVKVTR